VLAWLSRHPRWTFHFTPTSAPAQLARAKRLAGRLAAEEIK
jgi:hypothetical protein